MNLKPYVNIKITEYSESGDLVSEQEMHNLVTSTGLDYMISHILGQSTLRLYTYILGSGSTPAASTDTALQSSQQNLLLSTYTSTTGTATFTATLGTTIGWGSTYKEIGILTSSSQLIGRSILNIPIVKTSSSFTLNKIDWEFAFIPTT